MHEDRQSWAVKGADITRELRGILGITDADCELLKRVQPAARDAAPKMVEEFYEALLSNPLTSEFITDRDRLAATLASWFAELFCGNYDDAYANKRLAIGDVHVRIGLPIRYPLAMLAVIGKHGERLAAAHGEATVSAFRKVLALDVATFNQAYENNQLNHLAELTGSERLARRLLSGG
ncbi:MAG: protoglobin domain-containing protein [Stenotrophomonas sp.]|uniref:protoglobin domain-containing protein n=1 Tax=Stenotrophomonas sp. TaxID=69392 RepID=UPI003D6CDD08